MQKYLRHCTVFWHKWPVHDLVLVIPPPPLIKVASNARPYSKLGGTTLNGREEGGQYYILQTCEQQRFEGRKVVFPWECLNIFATGCSLTSTNGHLSTATFWRTVHTLTLVLNLCTMATSLPRPLSSVSKVAVEETFSCTFSAVTFPACTPVLLNLVSVCRLS